MFQYILCTDLKLTTISNSLGNHPYFCLQIYRSTDLQLNMYIRTDDLWRYDKNPLEQLLLNHQNNHWIFLSPTMGP